MPGQVYEFRPVSHIAVGAVGRPGQRVFLLQARYERQMLTLKMEKFQVAALAEAIDQIVSELERVEERIVTAVEEPAELEVDEDLLLPDFVVGDIGLGYDAGNSMAIIMLNEISAVEQQGDVARMWVPLEHARALAKQARRVVAGGRPICPLCNKPIDPEGHFCPGRNGHSTHPETD